MKFLNGISARKALKSARVTEVWIELFPYKFTYILLQNMTELYRIAESIVFWIGIHFGIYVGISKIAQPNDIHHDKWMWRSKINDIKIQFIAFLFCRTRFWRLDTRCSFLKRFDTIQPKFQQQIWRAQRDLFALWHLIQTDIKIFGWIPCSFRIYCTIIRSSVIVIITRNDH